MSYRDLREWLERIEGMGELKRLNGAHWDQEIGAITDLARRRPRAPALLFDEIKDYPRGFRVLTNSLYSLSRVAVTARLPLGLSKIQYVDVWREKHISMKPIPPLWVEDGPVTENILKGNEIDLLVGVGSQVFPIEIKAGATISEDYFKGLRHFAGNGTPLPFGSGLIYGGTETQLRSGTRIYPASGIHELLDSLEE